MQSESLRLLEDDEVRRCADDRPVLSLTCCQHNGSAASTVCIYIACHHSQWIAVTIPHQELSLPLGCPSHAPGARAPRDGPAAGRARRQARRGRVPRSAQPRADLHPRALREPRLAAAAARVCCWCCCCAAPRWHAVLTAAWRFAASVCCLVLYPNTPGSTQHAHTKKTQDREDEEEHADGDGGDAAATAAAAGSRPNAALGGGDSPVGSCAGSRAGSSGDLLGALLAASYKPTPVGTGALR